jgi:DNA polymerase-2
MDKGFIVYPTYRIIDDKAFVYLFGRLENGDSFLTINLTRPYFFIREKDLEKLGKIKTTIKYDTENSKLQSFYSEPVVKVILDVPRDVPALRDMMKREDILTYEADIRFVSRYLMDLGIKGSMEIKGDYKKGEFVNRIYENPELSSCNFVPKLRTLSIDIETSMDLSSLYCISLFADGFTRSLIVKDRKVKNAESFKTEKDLLIRFKEIIHEYDPDIITGWNLIDFDLKLIKRKFDENKIPFVLGRADWPCQLRIQEDFLKDSSAEFPGRMVLDGMHLLRISFVSVSDFKLQTAAEEILGDSKLDIFEDLDKGEEIQKKYLEEPEKLVEYNLKDCELVIRILEKKGIIEMTIQRSLLTGMQLDRVKASIASLDNLYIREANLNGHVCRTSDFADSEERIKGGYVRNSIPGIYDYIDVLDFKSLYPSIIRTFNIDPITFIPKELHGKFNREDIIEASNGAWFKKEIGILPKLIEELWAQRDIAKKKKIQEQSYAIKITMNSFFGVLANPMCRFYSLDMANAITHSGQFIVKKSADLAEELGYKVIYGDTDSIFLETKASDMNHAEEIGTKVQKKINTFWQDYSKENFGMKSYMEIQFEKIFVRFMMPKIRGTEIGAKKRYAGLMIIDGKEKIDFTGLEFVRRDWTELSKVFQLELIDRIFHKKEVVDYIKNFVKELKAGKHDKLLIYKKAIRKDLAQYTKTTPPHVKAARKLGKITSSIIAYVITTDGPEAVQKLEHPYDYDHYIDKQLKPIADSILGFYGTNFDDLMSSSKQTSLFGY